MCNRRIIFLSLSILMISMFFSTAFAGSDLLSCIEKNKNKYPYCGPWCVEPCEVGRCDVFMYEQDLCNCIYYPMTCENITSAAELHQKVWGSIDGKNLSPEIYGSFKDTSNKVQDDYEKLLAESVDRSKKADIAATKELVKWESYIQSLKAIEETAENLKSLYELSYKASQNYSTAEKKELEKLVSSKQKELELFESRDINFYKQQFESLPESRKVKYITAYDYALDCFDRDERIIEKLKTDIESNKLRLANYDGDQDYQEKIAKNRQDAEEQRLQASLRRAQAELQYAKLAKQDQKEKENEIAKIEESLNDLDRMKYDVNSPEKTEDSSDKIAETLDKKDDVKDSVIKPRPEIKQPEPEPDHEEDSSGNHEHHEERPKEEKPKEEVATIHVTLYSSDKTPVSVSITYLGDDGYLSFNSQTIAVTKDRSKAADAIGFTVNGTTWYPVDSSGISAIKTLLQYSFEK